MVEVALLALFSVVAGVCFGVLRRRDPGPTAFWTSAVVAIFGLGVCDFFLIGEFRWVLPVGSALGVSYTALILAGALAYAERRAPWWLLPVAVAIGGVRGLLAVEGFPRLSQGLSLAVEPTAVVVAAVVVFRVTGGRDTSIPQRALAPVLLVIAGLELASALLVPAGESVPPALLGAWVLGAPIALALQVAAASDRTQQTLLRVQDQLERRVAERTAELAESVGHLERETEERHRLDRHMREGQRLESLGVLAGGIAHDFNNVLTVILGNSRLALADLETGISPRDRLARIQTAAEHAAALTAQMLTYSGKASIALRPLDLSRLAHEMLDLLRASVTEKCQLDVDLEAEFPAIEGDATQMRQVILNLVSNASDAVHEHGGNVCVRTGVVEADEDYLSQGFGTPDPAPGEYVFLEVSDSGEGIEEEVRARVFEPFFTTKYSGRGLGLAAVLGIVSAHRGVIQVESEPGVGTTFRVLVPRSARYAELAAAGRGPVEVSAERGTILVVDDDEGVVELAREFLERSGFGVLTAPGGAAAIELFRARGREIDAVVLDLAMPEVGGEETFQELRNMRPDLPVVLASGYDEAGAAERFSARGISGFLYKPFEPEDLIERVREALRQGC